MHLLRKIIPIWVLANVLIGGSFLFTTYFWYLFPISLLILSIISIILLGKQKVNLSVSLTTSLIVWGVVSGTVLYAFFLLTYVSIKIIPFPLTSYIWDLYSIVGPTSWWHYAVLILIIIPGEEIFWRGYILKQFTIKFGAWFSVLTAAILYAIAHVWTGNIMLMAAALFAGLVWGILYQWKKSLVLIIVSHLVFDLWLLGILPLNF
ncbi:CPBP family intramembrane glutamic endopeptidase [Sutcliffiella rhizosphaerae]|uniref:CAAX prenyl protease 2/Lysostaphin resistance protein A-like domain-containing protein n=1 Tax=Sutcliffiella rhizosphaerae TaxID=2880967 RepID=A0ABN8A637_9BACI|nr:type II CAAX endopeptidase family protein [Sutcliffiella rhizosphaerae]CAG9620574.1 hypothetical protein BACCIP111883_01343 [Sutcliffiella rhizosphaerae]